MVTCDDYMPDPDKESPAPCRWCGESCNDHIREDEIIFPIRRAL